MSSGWGTVVALAAGALVTGAGAGCLIAYDFDDYGAGGASASTASASTVSASSVSVSSVSASSVSASTGAGPGEFQTCTDGDVTFVVLPSSWTGVRVVQLGRGFAAAPRDVLSYLVLGEHADRPADPQTFDREEDTDGLLGLLRLTISDQERVVGIRTDGNVVTLKAFDFAGTSEPVDALFRSARQFAGEPATILASAMEGSTVMAQAFEPFWDDELARPGLRPSAESVPGFGGEPTCTGCDLRAAVALAADGGYVAAYLGQGLSADAEVDVSSIGPQPFVAVSAPDVDATVFPLGGQFDEVFDVGPANGSAVYVSGIRDGENLLANLDENATVPERVLGPAEASTPSRFAKQHFMVTEFDGDVPSVAVIELDSLADPVFELADMRGLDVATVARTAADHVGVVVSALVRDDQDARYGDCVLPAGRAVLAEKDVAAP